MKPEEQFYADCGQIILVATSIEHTLGQHLTVFLLSGKPTNTFAIEDKFADEKFENKITLVQKLCEERLTNPETKERLLKALREIQWARNKIAHWGASYDPKKEKFLLHNRRKKNTERFDTHRAVKEAHDNYFVAYRALGELYNEIFSPKVS